MINARSRNDPWRAIVCSKEVSSSHAVLEKIRFEGADGEILFEIDADAGIPRTITDKTAIANAQLMAWAPSLLFRLQVARDVLRGEYVASLVTQEQALKGIEDLLQQMGVLDDPENRS